MRVLVCAVVCTVAAIAGAAPASAQSAGPQNRRVSPGLRLGATSGTLSVTGLPGFEPTRKTGMSGGGFLTFGRSKFRVQPEIALTTRNFSSPSPFGDIDVSTRSVDVPVLFVLHGRSEGRVHPLLLAGPYVSFISSVTQTIGGVETDIDSQIKGSDAGVVIGAGLEVDARRGAFVVDVRYGFGLKNLSETTGGTFKSRTVLASIGFRF